MKTKKTRSLKLVLNKSEIAKLLKSELCLIKGKSRAACNTDQQVGLCPPTFGC